MMKERKIYVVGNATEYANWMQGTLVEKMEDADLVVFTGGEDVTPRMYGEPKNPKTGCNPSRDAYEALEFNKAVILGKHIMGICRGSQFTCAVSGGRLIQHQENPYGVHSIIVINRDWDGTRETPQLDRILITSTHHQAMYPYDMELEDYKVLGWTHDISKFHENGLQEEISKKPFHEVEICYFPKTKVLGIQGHPEYMHPKQYPETFEYLWKLLDDHLNDKL